MTPLDRFTQDDLIAQLGMETVAKGLGYLSRVSALSAEGSEVSALVKGRQRTPYDVVADVTEADGRPTLVSKCTCPMGYDCKHVAAMMLLLLHQRRRPDRPREQVLAWVEGFRHAASALNPAAGRKRKAAASTHALRYVIEPDSYHAEYYVACYKVRLDQHGQIRQRESWTNIERALQAPPAFVDETDLEILRLLWAHRPRGRTIPSVGLPLEGRNSSELMGKLLARLHQAAVRRQPRSRIRRRPCWPGPRQDLGRWHGRHPRGRHDRRDRAGYRDGCRRSGHRQDHPPASNPWRIHWHGGGSGAWQLHGCAACAQVSPQPSYPDKARTGDGSGLVLCVPKQSPQNTVQLYSIHVSHFQAQALQPTPPRTHAALPNGSRALRDLARVGQRGSVRRPGRPPHPQALRAQSVCQVS